MPYQVGLIETRQGLEALREEWEALYAESVPRNPFLSHRWTTACWDHVCGGAKPFILAARCSGTLAAVAPLCVERRLGFRVLHFIGDGRSDYLGFLRSPREPGAQEALLEALTDLRPRWDLAVLRQMTEVYTNLPACSLPAGLQSRSVLGTVAPYLTLGDNWDAFCSSGPSSLRRSKRAAKKFLKEGGRLERYTGAEAAERVHEVAAVEASSWKGRESCARFQPGPGQRLLAQALRELGETGEMELWLAWVDAQPVAFQVNFLTPERLCYYQGSYHEEYRKLYPGMVLHYHCMERAWQSGLREYDFMSGDEAYKSGWTDGERQIRYRALFPATPAGYAAYGALVAPRWRLKGSPAARAALQWWVRARGNPMSLLALPKPPQPAAE
jgi:CelD/BcsL family acetyltransferase involved in cellulose biosynthesis